MIHSFFVDIAKKYGLKEAIILDLFYRHIEEYRVRNENCFEGKYWIRCSAREITSYLPYLTQKMAWNALKSLEKQGLIETGNFSETPLDRTKWYTLTDLGLNEMGEWWR